MQYENLVDRAPTRTETTLLISKFGFVVGRQATSPQSNVKLPQAADQGDTPVVIRVGDVFLFV